MFPLVGRIRPSGRASGKAFRGQYKHTHEDQSTEQGPGHCCGCTAAGSRDTWDRCPTAALSQNLHHALLGALRTRACIRGSELPSINCFLPYTAYTQTRQSIGILLRLARAGLAQSLHRANARDHPAAKVLGYVRAAPDRPVQIPCAVSPKRRAREARHFTVQRDA